MNPVQKKIYETVVAPALAQNAGFIIGEVASFTPSHNFGSVVYSTPDSTETIEKRGVPYMNVMGIKTMCPMPGDKVLIGFINNSYQQPIILGLMDKEYAFQSRPLYESHFRRGSNIPDYYSERVGEDWDVGGSI